MGSFKSKKKIYVSSTVYNLAGDETKRVEFLKTTVLGDIISKQATNLSQTITNSYLRGPGIKLRSFGSWARNQGYNSALGLSTGQLKLNNRLNRDLVSTQMPKTAAEKIVLQTAEVGSGDFIYWALQWMSDNYPAELNSDWTADYLDATDRIEITRTNGSKHQFAPANFSQSAEYLYASYNSVTEQAIGPLILGKPSIIPNSQALPSTVGWTVVRNNTKQQIYNLVTTVTTSNVYSDGRPVETTTNNTTATQSKDLVDSVWQRTVFEGQSPSVDEVHARRELMTLSRKVNVTYTTSMTMTETTIAGGVKRTTTVTRRVPSFNEVQTYQLDKQDLITRGWKKTRLLIYRKGSGNPVLETVFTADRNQGTFLPFVPVRISGRFISDSYFGGIYPMANKAIKKTSNSSLPDLISKIADNQSINDIDHAFVVFGVSLNVREMACRKYLYKFFQEILLGNTDPARFDDWDATWNVIKLSNENWQRWKAAQSVPTNPLYGTPEPARQTYRQAPAYSFRVASGTYSYDMSITWSSMVEITGSGVLDPAHKSGDIWLTGNTITQDQSLWINQSNTMRVDLYDSNRVTINWQDSPTTWRQLLITGLRHNNAVYKGKSVQITGVEALSDTEESGFIVPIHEEIFKRMSLVDATQMSTACCFIVLNSYEVVKQKWYQTGWFKIVLVVIVIVVTVLFPPSGGAAGGAGILGTNVAVGSAIGFTGMAAIIAGAIANAIAAMIVTQIISSVSTALLGDKLGTLVGAIASVITLQMGTSMAQGQNWTAGFSELTKADNLIKLTSAAGQGYQAYSAEATKSILERSQAYMTEYQEQSQAISEKYSDILGSSGVVLDPLALSGISNGVSVNMESMDTFLSRTQMTGSDISEMSMSMISEFVNMTINTNLE